MQDIRFESGGRGVLATAGADGTVNAAVYARPHVVSEELLAWGMTEGRTLKNVRENPSAAFIWFDAGGAVQGLRLSLELERVEDSGELLRKIRDNAEEEVGAGIGKKAKYIGYFRIVEGRPLV